MEKVFQTADTYQNTVFKSQKNCKLKLPINGLKAIKFILSKAENIAEVLKNLNFKVKRHLPAASICLIQDNGGY